MTATYVKKRVMAALSGIGVPVCHMTYTGKEKAYFTFFILSDRDVAWGDGEAIVSAARIQLDGWSKGDMDALCQSAKERLIAAGFRYELGVDLYESDTKTYHRAQQFYICKEE